MEEKKFDFWQDHSDHYLEMAFRTDRRQVIKQPDGYGKRTGVCGDTVEMYLTVCKGNNQMPIYEYRCHDCGATSEFLIGSSGNETIRCRNCSSRKLERLMSAASFVGTAHKRAPGHTCCGREERCETPPCSAGGSCSRP